MNRRTFLAAPVFVASEAKTGMTQPATDTPITLLFRKWLVLRTAYNSHPTGEGPEADVIWDAFVACEGDLLAEHVIGPYDFAIKLQASTDLGGLQFPRGSATESAVLANLALNGRADCHGRPWGIT